ncbi:hypothetical protein FGO68_gene11239 [Halteria grandinella]|uniref:Uncharacterized protein n=1 Tax=Halteria grandinella TaxID=5974 RepID=A0A8J8NRH8_HALGN|nr:hypothetical protein FGO68_gene11239 [Halteria grandinella]
MHRKQILQYNMAQNQAFQIPSSYAFANYEQMFQPLQIGNPQGQAYPLNYSQRQQEEDNIMGGGQNLMSSPSNNYQPQQLQQQQQQNLSQFIATQPTPQIIPTQRMQFLRDQQANGIIHSGGLVKDPSQKSIEQNAYGGSPFDYRLEAPRKQTNVDILAKQLQSMPQEDQIQKYMQLIIREHELQTNRMSRDTSPAPANTQQYQHVRNQSHDNSYIQNQSTLIKSNTPLYMQAPYYYPSQPLDLNSGRGQPSPLKVGSQILLEKKDLANLRLKTQDIDGAQPRNLNILKGRRHKDFFNEYKDLNEIYNKIGYQQLNDPLHHEAIDHYTDSEVRNHAKSSTRISNSPAPSYSYPHGYNQFAGVTNLTKPTDSQLSNYKQLDHETRESLNQRKREALFNGGAGQIKPQFIAFDKGNRLIELANGGRPGNLMKMPNPAASGAGPQTSNNQEYGKYVNNPAPIPEWIQQGHRKIQFQFQR